MNGIHPGFRRNHTKGVCVGGTFDSNGNGIRLSKAAVFKPRSIPVIGRFAVAVGKPFVPDNETESVAGFSQEFEQTILASTEDGEAAW